MSTQSVQLEEKLTELRTLLRDASSANAAEGRRFLP
jgi:hypothetical protein